MPDPQATTPLHPSWPSRLISVCLPTYKRPALLAEALESCFAQSWPEFEIVIGDDSPDDDTETIIASLPETRRSLVRYQHNQPALGQNSNVNDLFARARGDRLLLLHDDDVLLPEAVEHLAQLWEQCATLDAVFGKQLLIANDGTTLAAERSENLNDSYHRTAANAGRLPIPVVAGLSCMFPNDGFMVSTTLARRIGYRSMEEVGHACDTDFGMRLCAESRDVWFLDEFTLKYRISTESISKTSIVTPYTYDMLAALKVPAEAQPFLDEARREIAPSAVSGFAQLGKAGRALEIFFSPDYPLRRRMTLRGMYHLMHIVRAGLTGS